MPAWFDHAPFPTADPRAQDLHALLCKAYDSTREIEALAESVGIDLSNWERSGAFGPEWRSLLDIAAMQGKVRALLDKVLAEPLVRAFHARLTELMDRPGQVVTSTGLSHLPPDLVARLHGVALALIADEGSLNALLSELPRAFVTQLPGFGAVLSARIYGTLQLLNQTGPLSNGTLPMLAWIDAFHHVYEGRTELAQLEEAHELLLVSGLVRRGKPARKPAPKEASPRRSRPPSGEKATSRRRTDRRSVPPPPQENPADSPICVEVFHHTSLPDAFKITTRLFQILTGDRPAAFRDLHVPLRVFTEAPEAPLSRWCDAPRRLTLVLADEGLDSVREALLPTLRARAAAPDAERIVVAPLHASTPDPSSRDAWLALPREPAAAPDLPWISVDRTTPDARSSSAEAGLLEALCRWLPVVPGSAARRPTLITLCPADTQGRRIAYDIAAWMKQHAFSVETMDDPNIPLAGDGESAPGVVVLIRTDGWADAAHGAELVLLTKRRGLPVIVAEALQKGESRSFPYLANTPTVRFSLGECKQHPPSLPEQCAAVASLALCETLRMRLALHRLHALGKLPARMRASPRPPELLDAALAKEKWILYPDPPLGAHEVGVLEHARPGLRVLTPTQWRSLARYP